MSSLDQLKEAVAAQTTVIESVVTLLDGLKTSLDNAIASGDPAQLTALSATISDETKKLADAVVRDTPADTGTPTATT